MAVATNTDTRERRLYSGERVLEERGLVFAEPFDIMKGNDHISIPDATEHHKVNSTKSCIHASLNDQFPELAASNYVYQQYDR